MATVDQVPAPCTSQRCPSDETTLKTETKPSSEHSVGTVRDDQDRREPGRRREERRENQEEGEKEKGETENDGRTDEQKH